MKRLIVTADDFGLSEAVNEGVERAHREGVLTSASLMVAGAAAADAVRRARAMPELRVGLHLVVIEGPAMLPWGRTHEFPSGQMRLGVEYLFRRRQLEAEIRAQFAAYAATGLALDHADSHKHMHLHPVVGNLLLRVGQEFGLRAVRVPAEPPAVMARCGAPGGHVLYGWSRLFRHQARRAAMAVADAVFGLAWSGHMTADRLLRLLPLLPEGVSEIYCHPAARRDAVIDALMPGYRHEAELAALVDPRLRAMMAEQGIVPTRYGDVS